MNHEALIGLINNAALLLALGVVYDATTADSDRPDAGLKKQVLVGVTVGAIGVALMAGSWALAPGVIFDTRSVLLSVSGLFFGPLATGVAVVMSGLFRVYQGGDGVGMGVTVIAVTAGLGVAWRYGRGGPRKKLDWPELYLFGVAVHVAMLLCIVLLPKPIMLEVLGKVGLPVLLVYPMATVLLGMLLSRQIERREAAAALKASEEKFRCYVERAPLGIFIADRAGHYVEVNPAAARMLGYTEAELLDLSIPDALMPESLEAGQRHFATVVERGNASGEMPLRRKDGSPVWMSVDAVRLSEERFIAFCQDIAERKRAEATLQERVGLQEQMAKITASVPGVVCSFRLGPDGSACFPYASPAIQDLYGLTPEQLARNAAPLLAMVHPDDLGHFNGLIAESARTMTPWHDEFRVLHPVKGEIWVEGRSVPERLPDGGTLWHGFVMDITERKRADDILRASEERFRRAVEEAPFPVAIHAEDGEMLVISRTWTEITGYAPAEMPTIADWTERAYGVRQTQVREGIDKLYALERRVDEGEFTIACKDGSHRVWKFSSAPLGRLPDGRRAVSSMAADITERKQTEDQIRGLNAELENRVRERTAQLSAANRELETFAYSVSHDLKAPLRGIDGYSRLLEEDYGDKLDEDGRTFIGNIRLGARRMDALIEDLLAYSRMERRKLNSTTVDLVTLVQGVLAEQSENIQHRRAELRLDLPPIAPRADPDGLAIVLRNLLENALKFSADSPPPVVEIGGRTAGERVVLWVRDHGIGFDMKFHDRIFEIFQRLHRVEDYPGTGIGLALARKAMQRMGGRIWAESAPGRGATFYLELPL
ncbi:MAG: PAS domain S-box protein [Candidatus Competibacter sp.]|nr:PAS domain S-box protein [Candidatus Competibacter sp.]MDG4584684.1 PAS domain S-box protein [Candidatus Competibacter sp.]